MMQKMPVLFVGHGSPMNIIADNEYTKSLSALGHRIPRPKAICIVSAHWQTEGTRVCHAAQPRQIYDFYGFPRELFEIEYEPKGSPTFADRAFDLMGGQASQIVKDDSWGDDHAGWAVLKHLYPEADLPIFIVSVDMAAPASRHAELASRLAPLRDEGVLVLGSGNIVHNLYDADLGNPDADPDPRGVRFDTLAKTALESGDLEALVHYEKWGEEARYSVPTRDHYLPLLWAVALREPGETVSFPCEMMQNRSVSMRSVIIGL